MRVAQSVLWPEVSPATVPAMATYVDEHQRKGLVRIWIDDDFEVAASPDAVFALLSDIDGWPSWTSGLKAIKHGPKPLVPGGSFTMVLAPALYLPCKLYTVARERIEWGGDLLGSVIRHRFEITPAGAGRTRVRHVEYATNLLAVLTFAAEKGIHAHDSKWSRTIQKRFGA
jgi:Polyketide cyclase / dehydrase and lipid transport